MRPKELALLFSGCNVPAPEMERLMNELIKDELTDVRGSLPLAKPKMIKDKLWTDLERYIQIIRDEIRSDEAEKTTVDFYLFKIERRIKILKDYLDD